MSLKYKDVEMLDDSLNNLGDTLLRNRMMKQEQQRYAQQNQQQQARYAQEQQRLQQQSDSLGQYRTGELGERQAHDKAMEDAQAAILKQRVDASDTKAQPKIKAYIADSDKPAEGMGFEGTQEQLDAIMAGAKQKHPDRNFVVMGKPPSDIQKETARFTVGGSTHIFYTQKQADDYEAGLRARGIDPDTVKDTTTTEDETVTGKVDPDTDKPLPDVTTHRVTTKGAPRTPSPAAPKGVRVRNKKTGQMGTKLPDGTIVPDAAQ